MLQSVLAVLAIVGVAFVHTAETAMHVGISRPVYPSWPEAYSIPIYMKDFFGDNPAHAYFDYAAKVERFDYLKVEKDEGDRVSHFFNYSAMRQYIVSAPSGKCFWLPIVTESAPRREPLPLAQAEYVGEETIATQHGTYGLNVACFHWRVPIFHAAGQSAKTYVDYYSAQLSGLPVKINAGLLTLEFPIGANFSTTPNASDFELPVDPSICAGPYEQVNGTVPGTIYSYKAHADEETERMLDRLLYPQPVGYQGGDGGQGTKLSNGNTYICADDLEFGFRLQGQRFGFYGIIHNIVLIVSGDVLAGNASVSFYTGPIGSNGSPAPFFTPPNSSNYYSWTNGANVLDDDTMVMMGPVEGGSDNNVVDSLLITNINASSPMEWNVTYRATPFGQHGLYKASGSQILKDGYAYLFVYEKGFLFTRHFKLSRVSAQNYRVANFSGIEYYSSVFGWTTDATFASSMFDSDAPCSTVFYHDYLALYVALTVSADGYIGIALAEHITGPYYAEKKAYRIPDAISDGFIAYCPSAHQEWLPEDKQSSILLSYFTNGFSSKLRAKTSANSYKANFVRIDIELLSLRLN